MAKLTKHQIKLQIAMTERQIAGLELIHLSKLRNNLAKLKKALHDVEYHEQVDKAWRERPSWKEYLSK